MTHDGKFWFMTAGAELKIGKTPKAEFANISVPEEIGRPQYMSISPNNELLALSVRNKDGYAIVLIRLKDENGNYLSKEDLENMFSPAMNNYKITERFTEEINQPDFSPDGARFAFSAGKAVHEYYHPFVNVLTEEQPLKTQSAVSSDAREKIARVIFQLLNTKEDVLKELLVIPDEAVKALWVLATVRQAEYLNNSLEALKDNLETLKLFLQEEWFRQLVMYIENLQQSLLKGQGLLDYLNTYERAEKGILGNKGDNKPASNMDQIQIAMIKAEIDQLEKELAEKQAQKAPLDAEMADFTLVELQKLVNSTSYWSNKLEIKLCEASQFSPGQKVIDRVTFVKSLYQVFDVHPEADSLTILEHVWNHIRWDLFEQENPELAAGNKQRLQDKLAALQATKKTMSELETQINETKEKIEELKRKINALEQITDNENIHSLISPVDREDLQLVEQAI